MLMCFLKSDSGAVTVDWVVLSAATVGLGVGAVTVVRSGQDGLAGDIASSLSGAAVALMGTANARAMTFDAGDFSGWSSSRQGYSTALGYFLGPFAGSDEAVTHQVVLPEGATEATVTFDLLLLDSWDGIGPVSDFAQGGRGDGIGFEINGVEIGYSWMTIGSAGTPSGSMEINGTTYSYTMNRVETGDLYRVGTPLEWGDARWSVTVTATNPPSDGFSFGINSTANQPANDESFGIDNYRVSAVTP